MPPATSSPSGATTAADIPRRAAATAVIAPPPGDRRSSAANRSSPITGSDSSPTNVRSRKTGVATTRSVTDARGYPCRASSEKCPNRVARQVGLGDEAPGSRLRDGRPQVDAGPDRSQDQLPPRTGLPQPLGDLEPVDVWQLDVEEDDRRPESQRRRDPGHPIVRSADDDETVVV